MKRNFCLEKFGLRTVDYLESVGWLSGRTWLAHGIHFNKEEIKKLGENNVGICHCPTSNMMLASGICHSLELEKQVLLLALALMAQLLMMALI